MTLTKIKDVFAIFKNFVLEARATFSNGNSNGNGAKQAANDGDTEKLMKEIRDLKSCLVQRDTEISILVNMVKKNKSDNSLSSSGNNSNNNSSRNVLNGISSEMDSDKKQSRPEYHEAKATDGRLLSNSKPSVSEREKERRGNGRPEVDLQAREERLIKRHLFGVPPPDDIRLLEDAQGDEIHIN